MQKEYDVIIVGAGPAGVAAAYVLGQKNYNVLLLDKDRFPRKKLCGGCLTAKTLWLLERIFNVTEDTLTAKNVIGFKSYRFDIRYKNKTLVDPISPYAFRFVDREIYDSFFLKKVKELNEVEICEGEKVTHIISDEVPIKIKTIRGRELKTKFLIVADGANSIIRSKLFKSGSIDGANWQQNLAHCVEMFLPKSGEFKNFSVPILTFGYLRYGYGWIFPNKDRIVIGMGGLSRFNKNLPARFEALLNDYNLKRVDFSKLQGFPLPFGSSLSTPYYKNILLVGDAAGLVDPMLGEGIYQAHRSGELAALAINDTLKNTAENRTIDTVGPSYQELLHQSLLIEFKYAKRFRRILHNPLANFLGFRHVKLLKRHFSKLSEVVHGGRTYKWFKKI